MSTESEELLEHIERQLPNKGVWRWKDGEVKKTHAKLLVIIRKMQKAKMDDKDIMNIVDDIFWAAYAERDLQVREKTGMTAKELVDFVEQHKQVPASQPADLACLPQTARRTV